MAGLGLIRAFLEQATARGSRSTVLGPLGVMMPICVAATLAAHYLGAPIWLVVLFSTFSALTMVLYLFAYLYCLFKDRDALRTETYSIQKLAIEKGFIGDSMVGLLPIDGDTKGTLLEINKPVQAGEGREMNKRFILCVNSSTPEQSKAFTEHLRRKGVGWWHWLANTWLIVDSTGNLTAAEIRNDAMEIFPGVYNFATELQGDDTWAGFGPNGEKRSSSSGSGVLGDNAVWVL